MLSCLAFMLGGGARSIALWLWLVLAALAVLDLVQSRVAATRVELDLRDEIFVGETVKLRIEVAPERAFLRGRVSWPAGLSGPSEFDFMPSEQGVQAQIDLRAIRRGTWNLPRLYLCWPSRMGYFEFVPRIDLEREVKVIPNIRMVQSGEIETRINSTLYGIKENQAIGEGTEFHQLRDFTRGMDTRSIDWKRSAKKRSLVAKELHAERNHHIILALDNGYLMREEVSGLPKIDHAVTAALATAWAAALGGDQVGYLSYDARPRSFSAPQPGRVAFPRMRSWAAGLDYVSRETNHTLALSMLNARTPKRSLIVIFTDFIDTTSAELLLENVAILSKRHAVIFVTLRDPEMEAITGRAGQSLDGMARVVSAGQMLSERRLVLEKLIALGVMVLDVPPGGLSTALVSKYLEVKARELI